jgi:hypothetical protein
MLQMRSALGRVCGRIETAAKWILAIPPFGIGYSAGFLVRCVRLTWAAIVEGFTRGNAL